MMEMMYQVVRELERGEVDREGNSLGTYWDPIMAQGEFKDKRYEVLAEVPV